ncbi:unnamed protein product [Pleuronectes platessa]|uniref:Uncharacterized protein n=1 Tax=Pleuronectes platessa TaxID=8262 RepID=A0A9N7YCW3_PLEPL|nr:unnamed protein product [Pleuronectes platessa]
MGGGGVISAELERGEAGTGASTGLDWLRRHVTRAKYGLDSNADSLAPCKAIEMRRSSIGGRTRGVGEKVEVGGGGGFQSDRLTEGSDNERSGLSGVQTPSPCEIAAREGKADWWGVKGGGEGSKGWRRKCPLSRAVFDAAMLLPTPGRESGSPGSEEAMRGSCRSPLHPRDLPPACSSLSSRIDPELYSTGPVHPFPAHCFFYHTSFAHCRHSSSEYRPEKLGIKPPTFWFVDDPF